MAAVAVATGSRVQGRSACQPTDTLLSSRARLSVVGCMLVCMEQAYVPPGWPNQVPPPGAPGFERRAVNHLFDLCPPDYRNYRLLARHPLLLVRFTARLLAAQRNGTDATIAALRADMAGFVPPEAVEQGLSLLRAEQQRLERAMLEVSLLEQVFRGRTFVARM